jgi:flavin reductase (DIM6/NTAB) family NADH-FMN oxidoreductase RutF
MTSINHNQISELEKHYRTNLINSLIGYKPFNLLGTISESGATNLCVISSAFHMGSNPALFGMIIRPERDNNDSLRNIKSTGQYTLNNVLPEWYKAAHQTSASFPSGISEFKECELTEMYEDEFQAPFVKESNIRIGLKLKEIIDIKFNGTTLVIGEVALILTDDLLIGADGFIDHLKANTVTVAGLDSYYVASAVGRLSYAKPGIAPQMLPLS